MTSFAPYLKKTLILGLEQPPVRWHNSWQASAAAEPYIVNAKIHDVENRSATETCKWHLQDTFSESADCFTWSDQ